MSDTGQLRAAILERLSAVIDPETGVDVVRMRLIEDLAVDEHGRVSYKFRPSSPLCPLAVPLSLDIWCAVAEVDGVVEQSLEVVDYVQAEALTRMIREAFAPKSDTARVRGDAQAALGKQAAPESPVCPGR